MTLLIEEGPISSGTHRTVDLVPVFLDTLTDLDRAAAAEILREFHTRIEQIRAHDDILDIDYEDGDSDLMNALEEALNDAAPDGLFFGAAEGDGACFGFWAIEPD